ncbi:MAG: hypothetical protein RL885_10060 [Planctomycetota bacterium]
MSPTLSCVQTEAGIDTSPLSTTSQITPREPETSDETSAHCSVDPRYEGTDAYTLSQIASEQLLDLGEDPA